MQESEFLFQYEPFIQRQVRDFASHHAHDCLDLDDLLQEARLVFLNHLRKIPDESTVTHCRFAIHGALCDLCRSMSLVKIPKYCYGNEIKKIQRVDYEDAAIQSDDRLSCEADNELSLREFESTLNEKELIVCRMKQRGYSSREIIPFVGVAGEAQMSRLLKSVRVKASLYFAV